MTQDLDRWIGTERVDHDVVSLDRARLLAATLDRDPTTLEEGGALPAAWHWIYFNEAAPRSELGPDGHAERGTLLPPVPLPHRMWAGGRLSFLGPLRIGQPVERVSTIESITEKEGRSGRLIFVTSRHRLSQNGATVLDEEKVLVFRDATGAPKTPEPRPLPDEPTWSESFAADEVVLFRFSALTFNSHRIHYDHPYVTSVEGYPGLIVHGPLIALLVVGAGLRRLGDDASRAGVTFRYRAVGPLFCDEEFRLCGMSDERPMRVWAAHPERGAATRGEIEVAQ